MVVVAQAISHTEYPTRVYRVDPSHDIRQIHSVGPLPLHCAPPPTRHLRPSRRHHLRPGAGCAPTLGMRGLIYRVLWHVGVYQRGHVLPHRVARRPPRPPTASLAMAAAVQSPVDVHVDHGFLEIPLAPVLPAHIRRLWRPARRQTARAPRRAAGRVRLIRSDTRPRDVGAWPGNRVPHRRLLLRPHGRRSGLGACV